MNRPLTRGIPSKEMSIEEAVAVEASNETFDAENQTNTQEEITFTSLGLDPRLTRALSKLEFIKPTLIQAEGIPIALSGRDLLAKAPTGSGKTLGYVLPVLHKILQSENVILEEGKLAIQAIMIVPTKELAMQVTSVIENLTRYCSKELLRFCNLAESDSISSQKASLLASSANVIISTPSRLIPHLSSGLLVLQAGVFHTLVLDEADLLLSFGFQSDLDTLVPYLPKLFQTMLFSATLSDDLDSLKALLLHSPATIKVEDSSIIDADESGTKGRVLKQYTIVAQGDDKFLLTYVTLKLNLLRGKILIFCNSTDRAYRLKLFLDQFGVKSGVLNPELPLASRHAIVDQFNRSVFDILIASDPATPADSKDVNKKEGGVARGVDFKRVDVVYNFDFPTSLAAYTHRVGRTARGVEGKGTAVSLVDSQYDDPKAVAEVYAAVKLTSFPFPMDQVNAFRYRCNDAIRATTKSAVKRAQALELERQILASKRLATGYFADRPKDLELLRNDTAMNKAITLQPHLKHVPEYLLQSVGVRVKKRPVSAESEDANGNQQLSPEEVARLLDEEKAAKRQKSNYLYGGAQATPAGEEATGEEGEQKKKRAKKPKFFNEDQNIVAPDHLKLPQLPVSDARSGRYNPMHSGRFEERRMGYRTMQKKRHDPLKSGKLFK